MPPYREKDRLANAQGRQKACSECVKGKRKCDLGQPVCSRCRKQRIACTYPPPPPSENHKQKVPKPDHALDFQDDSAGPYVLPVESQELDTSGPALLDFDFSTFPALVNGDILQFDVPTVPNAPDSWDVLHDFSNKEDLIVLQRTYPSVEKTFSLAYLAPLARSRLAWPVEQMKLTPRMVVESNRTPWQHPKLYEEDMPRPLQDAHAACALYIARNDTNSNFVTRYITSRADELMKSPVPTRPLEILAHAHACILFQIMLVFSSDTSLHHIAEKLILHLGKIEVSLSPLVSQQTDPTGPLSLYPATASRAAWNAYIFRESLRRTLLCIHQFITLYHLLRGQVVSCAANLLNGSRVTISAPLWAAENAFDFAVRWNSGRHFLVKELDFDEVLAEATAEELDTFGKMILIGLIGIDDVRGWVGSRGGML